jgi:hypothetical protein
MSAEDDTLLITALVEYHDELRARNPDRARRAWTRARDIVAERGETIANGPVSLPITRLFLSEAEPNPVDANLTEGLARRRGARRIPRGPKGCSTRTGGSR